ncbi:anti-sigma factor family protein [Ramlibacter humi]|nr:anti-sigma factor [Ramlibacter humi]
MNAGTDPRPDEARLHALVDGQLPPAEREALRAQLAADPEAEATVKAWAAQREHLRALHAGVLREPVPPALAAAARHLRQEGRRLDRWQRWGGIAASVVIAFTVGWLAHGWDQAGAKPRQLAEFGRQAVVAHVVYSPEVRHPVEVTAAQQDHLVQWLSKRLGRPLKVPDLTAQGYELVGGRLLPGEDGARAQFMYQNARTERITLYVGAVDSGAKGPSDGGTGETAFRFTHEDGASSFYWVDQGFGYALAGRMGRAELLPLAETVYRQL